MGGSLTLLSGHDAGSDENETNAEEKRTSMGRRSEVLIGLRRQGRAACWDGACGSAACAWRQGQFGELDRERVVPCVKWVLSGSRARSGQGQSMARRRGIAFNVVSSSGEWLVCSLSRTALFAGATDNTSLSAVLGRDMSLLQRC